MDTTHRTAMNVVLGLVFVVGQGVTAYLIADSWGGLHWLFDCVNTVTWLVAVALGTSLRAAGRAS